VGVRVMGVRHRPVFVRPGTAGDRWIVMSG
jgi:hypothetical protein